eukprot:GABV01001526.1.p1 GENE.GABV01001526.1~~GABV01001526.1.p1  ORF type:complete len:270 (+),score=77.27 GABV01001526.1:119-811(+)
MAEQILENLFHFDLDEHDDISDDFSALAGTSGGPSSGEASLSSMRSYDTATGQTFHLIRISGHVFLMLGNAHIAREQALAFLANVQKEFYLRFGSRLPTDRRKLDAFEKILERMMIETSSTLPPPPPDDEELGLLASSAASPPPVDRKPSGQTDEPRGKMATVRHHVSTVTNTMRDTIQLAVSRGENMDRLEDRSESLGASARSFAARGRSVRRHFCVQMWRERVMFSWC